MSTIKFGATPLPAHAQATSDGPRKKRKRAPAQGAADDCFTCSSRNIKCDRRRPYCSQCLDGGQDCSGYKTQLTWGVGVASRGKLRGLSLPVAGTPKTANDASNTSSKSKKHTTSGNQGANNSTPSPRSGVPALASPPIAPNDSATFRAVASNQQPSSHASLNDAHTIRPLVNRGVSTQQHSHGVQAGTSAPTLNVYSVVHGIPPVATTYPQSISLPTIHDKSSQVQLSPYPTPSPTTQYFQCYPLQHQVRLMPTTHSYQSISGPPLHSSHAYPHPSQTTYPVYTDQHDYVGQTVYASQRGVTESSFAPAIPNNYEDDVEEINRDFNNDGVFSDSLSITSSSFPMDSTLSFPLASASAVGKTPRMQYLIQYYAEVIAPVCVAFDSPTNPLRNQILGLAARSESLQHAISALSASNIRQRRESGALSTGKTPGARRSSYMHQNMTNEVWDDTLNLTVQDRRREESLHKYAAVKMLNNQLGNLQLRKDDSVLATLLMLCLFHVCDSGIARFQTQFEGVKKLLTLRGSNFDGANGNTKWMTRMFTLFDSVAATVNDREVQINGQNLGVAIQADDEWSYETLSGIDSHLVTPISRLGRLNTLAQGLPVGSNPTVTSRPIPIMPFMNDHSQHDFQTFDGNGWMRLVSDENLFNVKTATPTIQEQFWREWREVRQDLQTWTFDNTRFNGTIPSQPYLTDEQRFDMCNISESFRYSSLLYTERLADPKMSSLDPKIQDWVQKALYHIKHVRADVYLLWPLFITGAECGDEQERNVIRERCLDIQKDSGFMNNSTCLTLLEKVWRGDNNAKSGASGEQARSSSTFPFRDVMLAEGNEGEWIVV